MKFALLNNFAKFLSQFKELKNVRRVDDNLFLLQVYDKGNFSAFLDLTKYKNSIFISDKIPFKNYTAPFDIALNSLARSQILSIKTDGSNKILIFELLQKNIYKTTKLRLQFELINSNTNVILLDPSNTVIEALRYLKNSREVKKGALLLDLPQPKENFKTTTYDEQTLLLELKNNAKTICDNKIDSSKRSALNFLNKKLQNLHDLRINLKSKKQLENEASHLREVANTLLANRDDFTPYSKKQNIAGREIMLFQNFTNINDAINTYFNKAKRFLKKSIGIAFQLENINSKIAFLESQIAFIKITEDISSLNIFKAKNLKKQGDKNFATLFINNYKFSIGRNERENKELLQNARANDIWMHVQNLPSSHGIIHCGKNQVDIKTIEKCAFILAGLTKLQRVNVDYTLRKFVRLKQGANVNYSKQKTLHFNIKRD